MKAYSVWQFYTNNAGEEYWRKSIGPVGKTAAKKRLCWFQQRALVAMMARSHLDPERENLRRLKIVLAKMPAGKEE